MYSGAVAWIQLRPACAFDVPRGIYFHISVDAGISPVFAADALLRVRSTLKSACGYFRLKADPPSIGFHLDLLFWTFFSLHSDYIE